MTSAAGGRFPGRSHNGQGRAPIRLEIKREPPVGGSPPDLTQRHELHEEKPGERVASPVRQEVAILFILGIHVSRPPKVRAGAIVLVGTVSPAGLYQPSSQAKTSGATMVASLSMMNLGVFSPSLPQVIFSLGTAPL